MKLVHGTSEMVARKALTEGIRPTSETGSKGNWEHVGAHGLQSHPDCVYLTTAYAGYYAASASDEKWGFIEVDTDLLNVEHLRPDEDFMEQQLRPYKVDDFPPGSVGSICKTNTHDLDMIEATKWYRDHNEELAGLWKQSIQGLGNCCHFGPIPPEAISRVVIYDPKSSPIMTLGALDPTITLMNYKFCAPKYQALTEWFLGGELDLNSYLLTFDERSPVDQTDLEKQMLRQHKKDAELRKIERLK